MFGILLERRIDRSIHIFAAPRNCRSSCAKSGHCAEAVASEDLSAGDLVNLHADGELTVRKASADAIGFEAHGYVLAEVPAGVLALVYTDGLNDKLTGLKAGRVFLSADHPGQVTATPPFGKSAVVQPVGIALGPTTLRFQPGIPVRRA